MSYVLTYASFILITLFCFFFHALSHSDTIYLANYPASTHSFWLLFHSPLCFSSLHFVLTIQSCTFHIPLSMLHGKWVLLFRITTESKLGLHLMNEARPPCHLALPFQTGLTLRWQEVDKEEVLCICSNADKTDNFSCVFCTISIGFLYSSSCYLWYFHKQNIRYKYHYLDRKVVGRRGIWSKMWSIY